MMYGHNLNPTLLLLYGNLTYHVKGYKYRFKENSSKIESGGQNKKLSEAQEKAIRGKVRSEHIRDVLA